MWAAISERFIREMLYFNHSAIVLTRESFRLLSQRSRQGCDHAHLPRPQTTWIANSSENTNTSYVLQKLQMSHTSLTAWDAQKKLGFLSPLLLETCCSE